MVNCVVFPPLNPYASFCFYLIFSNIFLKIYMGKCTDHIDPYEMQFIDF